MKKLLASLAVLAAFGTGSALVPAHAQLFDENEYWTEEEVGLWGTDNWATDEYGYYDQDFAWTAADPGWNTWYGNYGYDETWAGYEDIGEEEWYDIF